MPTEEDRHIRWPAIVIVTLTGFGITALPFVLSHWVDSDFGTWDSLASSALTNVGTTVLLVAVVFLVERGLVGRVRKAAEQRAAAVVDERTEELTNANRELSLRLDELQSKLEERVANEDSERLARTNQISTEVSFDTVTEALENANDLKSLVSGDITVPAGPGTDAPRVKVSWRPHSSAATPWAGHQDGAPRLTLRYDATRNPEGGTGIPLVEVDWDPHESAIDALKSLRDEMRRRGFATEATSVGKALFENLQDALTAAVEARMGADGAWAHGAMYEWLADGWAVTERGLVSKDHGIVESDEFPASPRLGRVDIDGGKAPFTRPAPDGVDADFWSFAVARARNVHPRGSYRLLAYDGGPAPAYTPSTSPRHRSG